MYTGFCIYFENIQYYFTELIIVQKRKHINNVTFWQLFGQNKFSVKSGQYYRKFKRLIWSYLHILFAFKTKIWILEK